MTESGAVELHHVVEGREDAPVLVMANSLGTTLEMWDDQAPELGERFRLVRYDHRGHGGSSVPSGPYRIEDLGRDALAMLDGLGVERFSFCGLSIGGAVGMWLASEVPERVERLVLCCTAASFDSDTYDARARQVRAEGVGSIADSVLERWFTPAFHEDHPDVVERAGRMLRSTPAEGYAGCCEALQDADLLGRLSEIQAPTLVISAAEDQATPPNQGRLIHDSIPGSRFEVVPDASHLANIEKPEIVTRAILGHLEPVAGRQG